VTTANSTPPAILALAYPFRWDGLEAFEYDFDADHVPRVEITQRIGLRYNPITIAQFGLYQLQRFAATQDEQHLCHARNNARWLLENARPWANDALAWVHDFDLPFYGPKAPWISGMAQGQAISFLLRMQSLVDDEDRLLECSHGAMRVFYHPVEEGGVATRFPDGSVSFEEYPTTPPSQVLNGHIFAMLGIHDYAHFFEDKAAVELFDLAVHGLKKNLHRYDTGYWNLYDLHPTRRLAAPMYVQVHVQLLRILAQMTGESEFTDASEMWKAYLTRPSCRVRYLLRKSVEKIRLLS